MKCDMCRIETVPSTNSVLLEKAAQGAAEGLVIYTDYQTAGRGKPGNKWFSPKGKNLLFSVLLRPPVSAAKAPLITQIACRSVARVLKERFKIAADFKRPNDLLVGGRKICGTLVEASSRGTKVEAVVIGIGLNVNAEGRELFRGSTSLKTLLKETIDLEPLLVQILNQLSEDIRPVYA